MNSKSNQDLAFIPSKLVPLALLLAASTGLFGELAIIRLQMTELPLFGIIKHFSLLSCFLGLGIGFLTASRKKLLLELAFPLLLLQVIILKLVHTSGLLVSMMEAFAETTGTNFSVLFSAEMCLVIFLSVTLFTVNALFFLPLGQISGILMERIPAVHAYAWNLIGSIFGVLLFWLVSKLCLDEVYWIIIIFLGVLPFLKRLFAVTAVAFFLIIVVLPATEKLGLISLFSPYQSVELLFQANEPPELTINGMYYQRVLNLSKNVPVNEATTFCRRYYDLPYTVSGQNGSVLIVGSGTGNDVAAALRNGSQEVLAVEIDPLILQLGKELHPERPYQSPRVRSVINDARNYFRNSVEKFDLIVFGLLDSHAFAAGKASALRIDSYVYTVEAFREARRLLKPDGTLALSFTSMGDHFERKLFLMLKEAFDGQIPAVIKSSYDGAVTYFAGKEISADRLQSIGETNLATKLATSVLPLPELSRDDWPFLYLHHAFIASGYVVILVCMALVSFALVRRAAGSAWTALTPVPFFLGAAFMLIETKAITELCLIFGTVFTVTTITILLILLLCLLANYLVSKKLVPPRNLSFIALLASVTLSYLLTFFPLREHAAFIDIAVRVTLLVLPIFFAGLCFSGELVDIESASAVLASNIFGAILGGMLEYLSLAYGFRALYVIAFLLYCAAFFSFIRKSRNISA